MREKSVRTALRAIHHFYPARFVPWILLHACRTCQHHLISLNILDLDPRAAPPKALQVIWWHQDVYSIRRRNNCVLKSVGDIKKFSNDIPWGCKGYARRNSKCTNDGGELFSKLRAVDLGAAIDTVTRFKSPHVFYRLSGWSDCR